MDDVSLPDYWSALYQAGDTGWDRGHCAPPIARLLREDVLPEGARIAVVGCGPGHEALEAARLGFQVTAIDFAPEAIAALRQTAAREVVTLAAVEEDVFELARRWPGHFEGIVEHTCLCAVDPGRRDEYVKAIAGALKPGGVLFGLFYNPEKPTTPPYPIDEPEVRARFSRHFHFERLRVAPDSFENRSGRELEFIARLLPVSPDR